MEVVYLLVPIAVLFAILIAAVLFWAIKTGQFDDLEGPAYSILMDRDDVPQAKAELAPGKEKDEKDKQSAGKDAGDVRT